MVNKKIMYFIYYILIIIALFVGITSLLRYDNNENNKINLIAFIPIMYSMCMLISKTNRRLLGRIGITTLNIIMFIRYVFLIMMIDQNYINLIHNFSNISIYLLFYEMFIVFAVINVFGKKFLIVSKDNYNKIKTKLKLDVPIIFTLLILISTFFLFPSVYNNFFSFSKRQNDIILMPGIFYVFSQIGIDIIFISLLLIIYIINNKKETIFKIIVSIIIIIIFLSSKWSRGEGTVNRWNFLLYGVVSILSLARLYLKHSKIIITIFVPVIIIFLVVLTLVKFNSQNLTLFEFFKTYFDSYNLDLYFNGLYGVNYGFLTNSLYNNQINFSTLLTDLFSAIPIISRFFDANINSSVYFFHITMLRNDTIIPTVAQGYIHFGFIGAPIFSAILTYLVLQIDYKLKYTKNVFIYFQLSIISMWFSSFMALNINIIQEGLWKRLFFILIIYLNYRFDLLYKPRRLLYA